MQQRQRSRDHFQHARPRELDDSLPFSMPAVPRTPQPARPVGIFSPMGRPLVAALVARRSAQLGAQSLTRRAAGLFSWSPPTRRKAGDERQGLSAVLGLRERAR